MMAWGPPLRGSVWEDERGPGRQVCRGCDRRASVGATYRFRLQGRGARPTLGRRADGAAKLLTGPETVQLGRGAPRARRPRGAADPSPLPPPQVKELQHHCIIHDAWRGARHRVQVRAREEFGHGSWSAWSPEAAGAPWTGTEWGLGGYPGLSKVSPKPGLKQQRLWREASPASPVLPVGPWRRVLLSRGHWDASGAGGGGGSLHSWGASENLWLYLVNHSY